MTHLITGAGMGLGKALAQQALEKGEHVVGIDVNWPDDYASDQFVKVDADLSNLDALDTFKNVVLANAPFSSVVFNAAVSATGPFELIPAGAHGKLMDINFTSPALMAGYLIKHNLIEKGGTLIFIASLSVQIGYPGAASYAASKAALASLANSLRKTLRTQSINVMTVYPGPMRTDQANRHAPKGAKPEDRMTPEEVAKIIVDAEKSGKTHVVPGDKNPLFALMGRLLPGVTRSKMKKVIYDKLDRITY